MCEHVETAQGVPLTVTGVAQCKIMTDKELLRTASEQFLGKTSQEVQLTILQTLEGHLRAILGTLSVEEVMYIVVVVALFKVSRLVCFLFKFPPYWPFKPPAESPPKM